VRPRDKRALVFGTSVILGALVLLRGVPASARAISRLRQRALDSYGTETRARGLLSAAPAVQDSVAQALSSVVALAPKLVEGHSSAEAQAALSGLVNLMATRNALKVTGIDPLPDSSVAVFAQVRVHAVLEGDIRGLVGFLRSVETGDPLLTAPSLSVSSPDPGGSTKGVPETLHLELIVAAYYLPKRTP
jgi:hypothetical protein